MRRLERRNGYVLLMTVVLIAIVGLLLAGMARQCLVLAVEANVAQEELQRRWGILSCQQTILSQADHILQEQVPQDDRSVMESPTGNACRKAKLQLGGMQFELVLGDESAKINLNTLYDQQGDEGVRRLVQENVHGLDAPSIRLRPYRANANTGRYPAFDSWGQIFSMENLAGNGSAAKSLIASTTDMTCWGDGKLNLEHASDHAVQTIGRTFIGNRTVGQLIKQRRQYLANRDATTHREEHWLPDLLKRLRLRASERQEVERLMADKSSCHSLWIVVKDKHRSWYSLCIADSATGIIARKWSYCW